MVPDVDPPPDYTLIANRKGRRASEEEKVEIFRLLRGGMTYVQLCEITQRSEDSLRKYYREMEAGDEATVRARAEAYQHMVNPAPAPSPAAAPRRARHQDDDDDDDDDDDGPPPPRARSPPPPDPPEPPAVELDLDGLFDEDELVDPTEEDALPKKLYVLLVQKGAVKDEDEARDIAQTWRMFPDYQSPHGLVDFLKSHSVKERKANLVARLLYGWQNQQSQQPGWNPGPVPGYYPGGVIPQGPPGSPGFHPQFPQPWGGGHYTGYGGMQGQPTLPGQYPYPWPMPQPPQPASEKGVSKSDIEKVVQKAVADRDDFWKDYLEKMEAKREKDDETKARQAEMDELRSIVRQQADQIHELRTNPQTAPPEGNYEAIEEPEYDGEGNVIRVRTKYIKPENSDLAKLRDDYNGLRDEMKEERAALNDTLKSLQSALTTAQTDTIKAQLEGEINLIKAKADQFKDTQDRIDAINTSLWEKEKQVMEMQYKNTGEMSEQMQIARMQMDFAKEGLGHIRSFRQDALEKFLILAGKGRPAGVVEEQWDEQELAAFQQGRRK